MLSNERIDRNWELLMGTHGGFRLAAFKDGFISQEIYF